MEPAHVERTPAAGAGPVTIEDARRAVGVFDDHSMDDHLTNLLTSATAYVRGLSGKPFGDETVTAYFSAWAPKLQMPQLRPSKTTPGFGGLGTIVVQYRNADGDLQQLTSNEYMADLSAGYLVVHPIPAVEAIQLDARTVNPVSVSMNNVQWATPDAMERIKQAIRVVLIALYEDEGELRVPRRAVADILQLAHAA